MSWAINPARLSRIETTLTTASVTDVGLILDALDWTEDRLQTSLLKLPRGAHSAGQSHRSVPSSASKGLISLESDPTA